MHSYERTYTNEPVGIIIKWCADSRYPGNLCTSRRKDFAPYGTRVV